MQILFYTYTCISEHKNNHSLAQYSVEDLPKISNICNISCSYFDYEKVYDKCIKLLQKTLTPNHSIKIFHNTEYSDELDYEVLFESEHTFIDLPHDNLSVMYVCNDLDNSIKAQIIIYFQEVDYVETKQKINTTLQ